MTDYSGYGNEVWDRFFEFVCMPVESMTREEIQQELRERKIDVSGAVKRVLQAVSTRRAREELEKARTERLSIISRLSAVTTPTVSNLRDRVRELIGGLQGTSQAAYFRKLESAATEDDLRALIEDVERLSLLSEIDDPTETNS